MTGNSRESTNRWNPATNDYLNQWRYIINCAEQISMFNPVTTIFIQEMNLEMFFAEWQPFSLGLDILTAPQYDLLFKQSALVLWCFGVVGTNWFYTDSSWFIRSRKLNCCLIASAIIKKCHILYNCTLNEAVIQTMNIHCEIDMEL